MCKKTAYNLTTKCAVTKCLCDDCITKCASRYCNIDVRSVTITYWFFRGGATETNGESI